VSLTDQHILERAQHLIVMAGLPDVETSALCDLGSSHIGMVRRGTIKAPSLKTLTALANVTGAKLAWLIGGDGEPPSREVVNDSVQRARNAYYVKKLQSATTEVKRSVVAAPSPCPVCGRSE